MNVVADSSVLIALSTIGQLKLLQQRFPGGILIPEAVWDEVVETGEGLPGAVEVESASWITVCEITDTRFFSLLRSDNPPLTPPRRGIIAQVEKFTESVFVFSTFPYPKARFSRMDLISSEHRGSSRWLPLCRRPGRYISHLVPASYMLPDYCSECPDCAGSTGAVHVLREAL